MKTIKYLFLCLFLTACIFGTSQNAKFYSLVSQKGEVVSSDYAFTVGVGRVLLPKYMDKPQIITFNNNSSEVAVSEYNRWIEAPSVLCQRALIDNLSAALPRAQIQAQQLGSEKFHTRLSVEVIKMDGVLGDKAVLDVWFTIKDEKGNSTRQKFTKTVPIGKTYDDLMDGYSHLWESLSQEVAKALIQKK